MSEAGYFDAVSITKPLLHLCLAVEEQFYVFWPGSDEPLVSVSTYGRFVRYCCFRVFGSLQKQRTQATWHFYSPITSMGTSLLRDVCNNMCLKAV